MASQSNWRRNNRAGLTLIELLVALACIGILAGLLLPALQVVRESTRRTHCSNNLRQLGIATQISAVQRGQFPEGASFGSGHSWISRMLPAIEQQTLYDQIDFDEVWNGLRNSSAVNANLSVVCCPSSSLKSYQGFTDYCGISGSSIGTAGSLNLNNGVLFVSDNRFETGVALASISDGLSHTIMVAEGAAVTDINFGYWSCGWHCFTHDDGGINNLRGGFNEIASFHPTGANVLFADGSCHFLNEQTQPETISALCTRNGHETLGDF